jgi:hypothetical protein
VDDLPDTHELRFALSQLRNSSPGPDGLTANDLRDPAVTNAVFALTRECWRQRRAPTAFGAAVLCALPKKPEPKTWDDYRGITLLSVAGKLLARVVYNRARGAPISEMQHGFRQHNSTSEAMLVLSLAMDEARRCGFPLTIVFVDLQKAYDSVSRSLIWDTCQKQGLSGVALDLLKSMYEDQIFVRMGGNTATEPFRSEVGLRQGCLLSPMLFSWVFDRVLRAAAKRISGVPIQREDGTQWRLKMRAYADDVAILSPNVWTAATDFAAFDEECRRAGTISLSKTKVIQMPNRFSHHDPAPPPIAPPLCTTPEEQIFYVLPSETSFSAEQVAEIRDQPRLCGVNPVARRRTTGSSKLHPAYRCPIAGCDYCGPTGGANHLRAHLDKGHDLRVNVLSVPPQLTLEPVPNLDGQGKLKCDV